MSMLVDLTCGGRPAGQHLAMVNFMLVLRDVCVICELCGAKWRVVAGPLVENNC